MPNLTKRIVNAAHAREKGFFVWCSSTPDFGLRVYPSGKKVFVARVRVGRRTRRLRVGVYGPFVAELCDRYLEAARAGLVLTRFRVPKRATTVTIDEGRASRHIKPLIGTASAKDLTRADLQRLVDQVTQGRTKSVHKTKRYGKAVVKGGDTAATVASLLGDIYFWPRSAATSKV